MSWTTTPMHSRSGTFVLPIVVFLFWPGETPAQSPAVEWEACFPALGDGAVAESVDVVREGGYVVAGWTRSSTGGIADPAEVYLVRTSSTGSIVWERTFGGAGQDFGESVVATSDGGFVVAATLSIQADGASNSRRVYLFKLDRDGDLLWEKTFGEDNGATPYSVVENSRGGFVVAGKVPPRAGGGAFGSPYLLETDSEGNLLWETTFEEELIGRAQSVREVRGGGYMVAGFGSRESGLLYLLRTDSNGAALWVKTFGAVEGLARGRVHTGQSLELQEHPHGGWIVVTTAIPLIDEPGAIPGDLYLLRVDPDGELDWELTHGTPAGYEAGRDVQPTDDGGCLVLGYSDAFNNGVDVATTLLKFDSEGTLLWEQRGLGDGTLSGRVFRRTRDGGYIVAGGSHSRAPRCLRIAKLAPEPAASRPFRRGDCDGDGRIEGQVTDAVFLLNYNFRGGRRPPCLAACDANGDGRVEGEVTDAVYLLTWNFRGGPAPVAPFAECGPGTAEDEALGCVTAPESCR